MEARTLKVVGGRGEGQGHDADIGGRRGGGCIGRRGCRRAGNQHGDGQRQDDQDSDESFLHRISSLFFPVPSVTASSSPADDTDPRRVMFLPLQ